MTIDHSHLRSLAAAATPGEDWRASTATRPTVYVETTQRASDGTLYGGICWIPEDEDDRLTDEARAQAQWIAAAAPQVVVGLLDRIEELEKQLIEACEWWESHLDGFAKRLGEEDGGIKSERRRLDTIKRRAM
jgi:hypothetical protein